MIWPVDSSVSQAYGSNPTANLPQDSWLIKTFGNYQPNGHTGVDFPVAVGTPVQAAADGVVKHVGWYSGSYADNPYWISPSFAGFVLVIDHGAFVGIYAHLSGSPVAVGETVREGRTVAYSGNSGGSTGPHLHFEILPDGWDFNNGMYGRVNPAAYITGGAAIAPQGTITKEDELSAAEVKVITDAIADVRNVAQNTWAGVWTGGTTPGGKKFNYGILPIVAEIQRRDAISQAQIAGLVGAIAALSKGEKFDEAKLLAGVQAAAEAGVKAGITDGTVTVDVNVNGAPA